LIMTNSHPIEKDVFYNRLSQLIASTDLNPVDRVLFLATFESWYNFQSYAVYKSISEKAIQALEECYA
ncbi:hypothetical protein P7M58_25990, partial [Vibrio parahaemolyticus]|nr:hypothetical protein [Vibrio parahaemolyticus]